MSSPELVDRALGPGRGGAAALPWGGRRRIGSPPPLPAPGGGGVPTVGPGPGWASPPPSPPAPSWLGPTRHDPGQSHLRAGVVPANGEELETRLPSHGRTGPVGLTRGWAGEQEEGGDGEFPSSAAPHHRRLSRDTDSLPEERQGEHRPPQLHSGLGSVDFHNGSLPEATDPSPPHRAAPPQTRRGEASQPLASALATAAAGEGDPRPSSALRSPKTQPSHPPAGASGGSPSALCRANTNTNHTTETAAATPLEPATAPSSSREARLPPRFDRSRLVHPHEGEPGRTKQPPGTPQQRHPVCAADHHRSDPASPSTATTATSHTPPSTPTPPPPTNHHRAAEEATSPSRSTMGHSLPANLPPNPPALSVSVITADPQQRHHVEVGPETSSLNSPNPDTDGTMEPHERFPSDHNRLHSRQIPERSSSCSLTEGKHREADDWGEADDETVTVQSFDSATVASPALAPLADPEGTSLPTSNPGPVVGLLPGPAAAAVETPSTASTDLETDEASLGDLMSLERSFLASEQQEADVSFLDASSPLVESGGGTSSVHVSAHHHQHHRVPSWEGLLPRASAFPATGGFDDVGPRPLHHGHPLSPPSAAAATSAAPSWGTQQRVTSFRAHGHHHSGGGGSFGYSDRYAEPTGWQPPQQQHLHLHQPPHLVRASPPVPFLPPGRGTPPIDNRGGGGGGGPMSHQRTYQPYHPQLQQHQYPAQPQQHPQHGYHPHLLQHPQAPPRRPAPYGPHQQQAPGAAGYGTSQPAATSAATPPRRGQRLPPPPSPHRAGYGGGSGPVPALGGGGMPSTAGGGGGASAASSSRSASEVLKTLLRKKACLYEADTSRAVALVTWLVGRELAVERGYFSRQQLQAGVHACVADKIDAGVITRTKVNRCMQIILNSCFHYIIPRPDGTEENGEAFGRTFATEADDDSYLLQVLPEPWTNINVDTEKVLQAAEQAEWETKTAGPAVSTATGSATKKGSDFSTPQSSPRLTSQTPDKGSPGGRDSLDGDDGAKRAVLLCFNENVRRAEDVFRCHNEFIRDTAHGSHLQLSSQEWRSFFGAEAASAPYLWGNVGIPVLCTEVHGSSHVDALGMMTSDEAGKFRTTWCTKRYEHDHELCGFAHVEVNGGWLRRNPLGYTYKDEICPFVSNITDKHTGHTLFVINECPLGTNCEFAHSSEEMMYHPRRYKMRACPSAGRSGGCGLGDVCPNFHPTDTYRFPKKSEGRSSRHSKYSHSAGAAKGGPSTTPSGAPILMAGPAPLSSFDEHLQLPGLRNLYRRQCSVVRAHLRQRGSPCLYSYFGDDEAATAPGDNAHPASHASEERGHPPRA